MRILMPRITSRFASHTLIAAAGSAQRISSSSPTDSEIMPIPEMFRKAKRRVSETSITYRRRPEKVEAPAEPASTAVVTPLRRTCSSALMP